MSGCGDGDAVQVSKEMERTAQQVLGGSHPITTSIELDLKDARAALREKSDSGTLHPRYYILLGVGPLLGPRGPRLPQERHARGRGRFP